MELTALHAGLLGYCTLNMLTFGVYWHDKESARDGKRRVRERTLLWLAMIGGSIGAIIAQQLLRHKTRKEPFRSLLWSICILHAGLAMSLLIMPEWPSRLVSLVAATKIIA